MPPLKTGERPALLGLSSTAFRSGDAIPKLYTCEGDDTSPPLEWAPAAGTTSFVLLLDDPDIVGGIASHWVLYNLPSEIHQLARGVPRKARLPFGGMQGVNDFGVVGYTGPCSATAVHRYFFRLFALDDMLELPEKPSRGDVVRAMRGHVLGEDEMMVTFVRRPGLR